MAEKNIKKEVKKTTSKKPVEQPKTSKKPVEKSTKKTEPKEVKVEQKRSQIHNEKEIKIEPKRSQKHEVKKVIEEQISNDMLENDKDNKIWIVIALLLIFLVGGAFLANKVVDDRKTEESSNNKILVSKVIFENEDGTIDVKVKIKSKIGLKTITLEDGTVMNFNNKKDVEVKFTAKENKAYILIIKDKNGTKTRKKIKITQVKESMVQQKEDHELVVEEEVSQPNYVVYYYRPQKNEQVITTKVEENAPQFDVENDLYTNKNVIVNVKNSVKTTYIFNDEEPKIYNGEELNQDGTYEMTAINNSGKSTTVHFTIDTKAPVFINLKNNETYVEMVSAIATDDNLKGYTVNFDEYDENSDPVLTDGSYTVIAYDLAGNETKVNIKVNGLFNESNTINNYGQMVFNNQVTLNYDIKNSLKLYKTDENGEYTIEVEEFNINNSINEEGNYKLDIQINGTTKYYYFVIDKTKPEIVITGKDENSDDVYENVDIKITDDSNIVDKQYGYNNDGKVETKPIETKLISDNSEDIDKPKEDDSYLWVSSTDIAGNTSVVVSDKPVQKEEQQNTLNPKNTEVLTNEK